MATSRQCKPSADQIVPNFVLHRVGRVADWVSRRVRGAVFGFFHSLAVSRQTFDSDAAVLVTGSPRSGTTWLTSVVANLLKELMVDEPLYLSKKRVREAGFTWRTHLRPNATAPAAEGLFSGIFAGRYIDAVDIVNNPLCRVICSRRTIVKSVRATRLLGWLENNFPSTRIVVLVRHPCAVISSQLLHSSFPNTESISPDDREYVRTYLPHLSGWLEGLSSVEEFRALTWALDQHAHLTLPQNSPRRVLVRYEDLVMCGLPYLRGCLSKIGVRIDEPDATLMNQNSREARSFSVDHARASSFDRLNVWKERLNDDQAKKILKVIRKVGIRGYGDSVLPVAETIQFAGGSRSPEG